MKGSDMFLKSRSERGCWILILALAIFFVGCSSSESTNPETNLFNSEGSIIKFDTISDTTIRFALSQAAHVRLEVTNATGHHVKTLIDEPLPVGAHEIIWTARNDAGEAVGPGIYLAHLSALGSEFWQPLPLGVEASGKGIDS